MAVDETINNLIKELKQERKSHHKVRDELGVCVERDMEKINRLANVHCTQLAIRGPILILCFF